MLHYTISFLHSYKVMVMQIDQFLHSFQQYEFHILHITIYFVGMQRLVPAQMACFCFVVGGTHLVRYDLVFFCLLRPVSCWHKCCVHTILRLLPYILVSSMLKLVCHEFCSWLCLPKLNYHTWICCIHGLINAQLRCNHQSAVSHIY